MTPKKSMTTQETEMHVSPFEQITQLENEQEARVAHALDEAAQEKLDADKMITSAEKTQETSMRDQATEALKEYARTEPASILKNNEERTMNDLKEISSHAEKKLAPTAENLLKPVLDGSIFNTAA